MQLFMKCCQKMLKKKRMRDKANHLSHHQEQQSLEEYYDDIEKEIRTCKHCDETPCDWITYGQEVVNQTKLGYEEDALTSNIGMR